jgi:hypothetical protein
LLDNVPLGVTTSTTPLVAPAGAVVAIALPVELTVNGASAPLNVTLVAPVKFVPRILTVDPVLPEVGRVMTNGPKPIESSNTFPDS